MPRRRLAAIKAPGIQYATESDSALSGLGGSIGGKIKKQGVRQRVFRIRNGVYKPFIQFIRTRRFS